MIANAAANAQRLVIIKVALHANKTGFGGCMPLIGRLIDDFAKHRVDIDRIHDA